MFSVLVALVFALLGLVTVAYGVSLVSPPAAWVIVGLFCWFVAAWPAIRPWR